MCECNATSASPQLRYTKKGANFTSVGAFPRADPEVLQTRVLIKCERTPFPQAGGMACISIEFGVLHHAIQP